MLTRLCCVCMLLSFTRTAAASGTAERSTSGSHMCAQKEGTESRAEVQRLVGTEQRCRDWLAQSRDAETGWHRAEVQRLVGTERCREQGWTEGRTGRHRGGVLQAAMPSPGSPTRSAGTSRSQVWLLVVASFLDAMYYSIMVSKHLLPYGAPCHKLRSVLACTVLCADWGARCRSYRLQCSTMANPPHKYSSNLKPQLPHSLSCIMSCCDVKAALTRLLRC